MCRQTCASTRSAFFIEPVLLTHDPSRFRILCYDNDAGTDATKRRLQELVDGWRPIRALSDEEVAALIRRDGVDILVDLSGHTDR